MQAALEIMPISLTPGDLRSVLSRVVTDDSIVTAWHDSILVAVRKLCEDIDPDALLPWGKVVQRVQVLLRRPESIADDQQIRTVVGWLAKSWPVDSAFSDVRHFEAFHDVFGQAIDELRQYQLLDEMVDEIAVRGLELESALKQMGLAMCSALEAQQMGEKLPENRALNHLVVITHSARKPLRVAWLKWICSQGVRVTVVIPSSVDDQSSAQIIADLGQLVATDQRARWWDRIFSDRVSDDPLPSIRVQRHHDVLAECEHVMRECLAAQDRGVMPHRIGIFCRDFDTYGPLLAVASQRHQLPLDRVTRVKLATNSFIHFTNHLVKSLAGHDPRELAEALRSSYVTIPPEELESSIHLLAICWRRGGHPWTILEEADLGLAPTLASWLAWRQGAKSAESLSIWLNRLRQLWSVEAAAQSMTALNPTKARDEAAKNALERVISRRASVLELFGGPGMSLATFSQELLAIGNREDMVLPRAGGASILVAGDASLFGDIDCLFVLGAADGSLPRRPSPDPILPEPLRLKLAQLHPESPRLPLSRDDAAGERRLFQSLCATARQELVFSYPESQGDRLLSPSVFVRRLEREFAEQVKTEIYGRTDVFGVRSEKQTHADTQLMAAMAAEKIAEEPWTLRSETAQQKVRLDPDQMVNPAELAAVNRCAFESVFRYRLELKTQRQGGYRRRVARIPADARLADCKDRTDAETRLRAQLEEALTSAFAIVDPWELRLLEETTERLIPRWIQDEFDAREIWGLDADSIRTKVPLGQGELKDSLRIGDQKINLKGEVDTVRFIGGFGTLQFYLTRPPALKDKREESEHDDFLFAIWLRMAKNLGVKGRALLIDAITGDRNDRRNLWVLKSDELGDRPRPAGEAKVVTLDPNRVSSEAIANPFRQAHQRLSTGYLEPTPGARCERCAYGELCRVSRAFQDGDPE